MGGFVLFLLLRRRGDEDCEVGRYVGLRGYATGKGRGSLSLRLRNLLSVRDVA